MQHICVASELYRLLDARGEAAHAAYLKTSCDAAQGDLLIHVMEQAIPGGYGAPLGQLGGRAVSGSHRPAALALAGTELRAVSQRAQTLIWTQACTASSMR